MKRISILIFTVILVSCTSKLKTSENNQTRYKTVQEVFPSSKITGIPEPDNDIVERFLVEDINSKKVVTVSYNVNETYEISDIKMIK